jgi:nitrogen-specific signal transduction histidine kinase/ActR/RegA family two-component response regulator
VGHFIPGQHLSVLRDVTERRRTQEMVQQQERLAAVGQLAAGIAHDFNNVMSAIVLYAQILQRRDDLSDKERRRLDIIYRQANHAIDLIKQILDFSRRSVMERSAMDLVPFFKEMFRLFEHTLPESIKLALHYQAPDYIVVADPTRLQQAIMNLAINARDAMPDGGSFTVSLSRLELLPENMPPAPDMAPGPWLRISVAGEGYGMSEEMLQHVFEPFYTTKGSSEGTGLGLAQVYGIIRQHDGYITVDSIEGQGTTFTIYLPLIEEDTQATEIPPPTFDQAVRAPREATVLVVEDEEWARIAVEESLEALGYHVLAATNGREALDIFADKERHVDLVLSDMVMPEMGGLVLYEQIRAQRPQMKMVFMSGYPLQDAGRTLLERGAVDWIAKPFSVNDLAQKVAEMIAGG